MCFDDPVLAEDEALCPACLVPHTVVGELAGVKVIACPFAPADQAYLIARGALNE